MHDINNMGGGQMPAAPTLPVFLQPPARPQDFDAIFTGDLGKVGSATAARADGAGGGLPRTTTGDCGCLLYDRRGRMVQAGGSWTRCSAAAVLYPADAGQRGQLRWCCF